MRKSLASRIWNLTTYVEFRVLLVLLLFIFSFYSLSPLIFDVGIWKGLLKIGAEYGIMSIGEGLLMISGCLDLSIASVYGWSCFLTIFLTNMGVPLPASFIFALAIGAAMGLINGIITVKSGVHPVIVTLATMWFWRGLLIYMFMWTTFMRFTTEILPLMDSLFNSYIGFVPVYFIWLVSFVVIFTVLLTRTKYGNWVYATGGSSETARALGVNVNKVKYINFILCSTLAAFAGGAYAIRTGWAMTRVGMTRLGFGYELEAIAICVMGGLSLFGGAGSFVAIALATIAFTAFRSGLILIKVPGYWVEPMEGLILIAFCILHMIKRK